MSEEKSTNQLASDDHWSGEERRSHSRCRCRDKTLALFVIRPSLKCFRVTLWDASPRGISFLHDAPLERGTVLVLQLGVGTRDASFVRTVRVAHATPRVGKWLIGCRLSPPLSNMEMENL
jgi:hypothetical protein